MKSVHDPDFHSLISLSAIPDSPSSAFMIIYSIHGYFSCQENTVNKRTRDSGEVYLYQPANDIFVEYEYSLDEGEKTIILQYNSSVSSNGLLKILIPWSEKTEDAEWPKRNLQVLIDGKQKDFRLETRNNDLFILIDTDFDNHTARISLNLNDS
jgi:hypothetical protein